MAAILPSDAIAVDASTHAGAGLPKVQDTVVAKKAWIDKYRRWATAVPFFEMGCPIPGPLKRLGERGVAKRQKPTIGWYDQGCNDRRDEALEKLGASCRSVVLCRRGLAGS